MAKPAPATTSNARPAATGQPIHRLFPMTLPTGTPRDTFAVVGRAARPRHLPGLWRSSPGAFNPPPGDFRCRSRYQAATWYLLRSSSFRRMCDTRVLTVSDDTTSRSAISRFVLPSAISRATSRSLGVSPLPLNFATPAFGTGLSHRYLSTCGCATQSVRHTAMVTARGLSPGIPRRGIFVAGWQPSGLSAGYAPAISTSSTHAVGAGTGCPVRRSPSM